MGAPLLLRRRSKGVSLTSAGMSALPLARELLGRARELELTVGEGEEATLRGPVRLGAFHTLAPSLLPALIAGLADACPEAEIHDELADQDELASRLADGDLDLAVVYGIDFPPEFETTELYRTSARLILPEGHRLAGRDEVELAEVVDEPMVLFDVAPPGSTPLSSWRGSVSRRASPTARATTTSAGGSSRADSATPCSGRGDECRSVRGVRAVAVADRHDPAHGDSRRCARRGACAGRGATRTARRLGEP